MVVLGALAGLDGPELRATFNGGLGMTLIVPDDAAALTVEAANECGVAAWIVGEVVETAALGGVRYREEGRPR
jgi:phosphoribosylaminoimidazole (AIR) synthetase